MGHGRIWQPTSFPFFLFSCPSSFQFRLSTWRGGVLRGPLSEWREEETLGTSGILWREKLTSRPLTALRLWRRWRHGMMFLFFFFAYSLTRSVLYISSYFFFPPFRVVHTGRSSSTRWSRDATHRLASGDDWLRITEPETYGRPPLILFIFPSNFSLSLSTTSGCICVYAILSCCHSPAVARGNKQAVESPPLEIDSWNKTGGKKKVPARNSSDLFVLCGACRVAEGLDETCL